MARPSPGPTPDPLAALGPARPLWDAFLARAAADLPAAEIGWKSYAGKTGRQCVIRLKDRNLAYLKPGEGSFLVSVALSDGAVAGLAGSKLPASLIEEIEAAPKYPEGRPARVLVSSSSGVKHAVTLLALKTADVLRAKPKPRPSPRRK